MASTGGSEDLKGMLITMEAPGIEAQDSWPECASLLTSRSERRDHLLSWICNKLEFNEDQAPVRNIAKTLDEPDEAGNSDLSRRLEQMCIPESKNFADSRLSPDKQLATWTLLLTLAMDMKTQMGFEQATKSDLDTQAAALGQASKCSLNQAGFSVVDFTSDLVPRAIARESDKFLKVEAPNLQRCEDIQTELQEQREQYCKDIESLPASIEFSADRCRDKVNRIRELSKQLSSFTSHYDKQLHPWIKQQEDLQEARDIGSNLACVANTLEQISESIETTEAICSASDIIKDKIKQLAKL